MSKNKMKFQYDDQFKEDLIHQIWHIVNELNKLNATLNNALILKDSIDNVSASISELSCEIYKYRRGD